MSPIRSHALEQSPAPLGRVGRMRSVSTGRFPDLVGSSPLFEETRRALSDHVDDPDPLLLLGEPGTGKRLAVHALHRARRLAGGPILSLDCSELDPGPLERELFGDERSMGLLDVAESATVVLQRMESVGRRTLRRLRKALDERGSTRRPRIVGTWRMPFALEGSSNPSGNVVQALFGPRMVTLPPLRHRDDDLDALTELFLLGARGTPPQLSAAARFALASHRWPGNIRELRSVIRKAIARGTPVIDAEDLAIQVRGPALREVTTGHSGRTSALEGRSLAEIEADAVRAALRLTNGNRTAAAKILGVSRPTVLRKIREYGLGAL